MTGEASGWTTQQLVEFLASVSSYEDAESAILGAVEAAALALDAEMAAVVIDGRVEAAIGFRRGDAPVSSLIAAAGNDGAEIELPGAGPCPSASAPVDIDAGGWLLVARSGGPLESGEQDLLRGMGRVLAMSLGAVRLLESLHERQALLERLSRLQRSIARRADLQDVLDAIVEGALELLGDETTGVRLLAPDDPGQLELVSCTGLPEGVLDEIRISPVGVGAGGLAVEREQLVTFEDYEHDEHSLDPLRGGLKAAMAAPIFERGRIAGSLVVATKRPGRRYSASEREALQMFAEHAGLALNDARMAEETLHQAFHDSLTELPNRANFLDRLERVLATGSGRVAVLFADLDGFKTVNDSLGHQAGDELLLMVARRLRSRLRSDEGDGDGAVARFGGDEFAILVEDCPGPAAARRQAQRLLEALEDPFAVRGREVHITASIGIAVGEREADHLLRNADLAMYQAKSRGKGRCEIFEPGMHRAVVERLELEADLKRAIDGDEIILHYQPICGLSGGRIVALEALARWEHPTRGLIPPADFIPLAEESRQILALGRRVLREACRQLSVWQARFADAQPLHVGVNLSGIQLEQPSLVGEVRTAIERSGIPPETLTLEITETALMSDTEANIRKLTQLKELGVNLAVDDFGTGYSSLEYLRRFPIDILKIAKSFVDDVGDAGSDAPLVRAIIELAHSFDLVVVGEGIERPEQRQGLLELGCKVGQGFHLAMPASAGETESLLLSAALDTDGMGEPMRLKLPAMG